MSNRYPGIRSFQTDEQNLFFGRAKETQDLYHLLKVETVSVLFAKSGIGKTSLINAGLVPLLQADHYHPIFVRFQDTKLSPLQRVQAVLEPYIDASQRQHLSQTPSLWESVKASTFGEQDTPVLILDQFEEFFSHSVEEREKFTQQLADLVHHYLPDTKQAELHAIPRRQRTVEELTWYRQPQIKVLLSIRSDRLSQLDEMTQEMPAILNNRFHLKPLDAERAKQAITEPPRLSGDHYATKAFSYSAPTLQHILTHLSDQQEGSIESFQLQLLCNTIEEKVKAKQEELLQKGIATAIKEAENIVVTPDYLTDKASESIRAGIENILNNYYENKIKTFPSAIQPAIREFIEDGLIEASPHDPTQGKRVSVANDRVQNRYGIKEGVLQQLLATRLIRAEVSHLGRGYEISHDTLVAPILKSYRIRRDKEEQLEQQQRLRKARLYFIISVTILLFIIGLLTNTILQYKKAKAAQEEAKAAQEEAIIAQEKAIEVRIQAEMAQLEAEMAKTEAVNFQNQVEIAEKEIAIIKEKERVALTAVAKAKENTQQEQVKAKRLAQRSQQEKTKADSLLRIAEQAQMQRNATQFKVDSLLGIVQTIRKKAKIEQAKIDSIQKELRKLETKLARQETQSLIDEAEQYMGNDGYNLAIKRLQKVLGREPNNLKAQQLLKECQEKLNQN